MPGSEEGFGKLYESSVISETSLTSSRSLTDTSEGIIEIFSGSVEEPNISKETLSLLRS